MRLELTGQRPQSAPRFGAVKLGMPYWDKDPETQKVDFIRIPVTLTGKDVRLNPVPENGDTFDLGATLICDIPNVTAGDAYVEPKALKLLMDRIINGKGLWPMTNWRRDYAQEAAQLIASSAKPVTETKDDVASHLKALQYATFNWQGKNINQLKHCPPIINFFNQYSQGQKPNLPELN